MNLEIQPATRLVGSMRPPSDKSLTHRAYMLAAAATGDSLVSQPLRGEDCESTLSCLAQLGLNYEAEGESVRLFPVEQWTQPKGPLDCGNSGTTMRLLSGLVASRNLDVTMVGDESLSRRPMRRIAEPLRLMGAVVEGDTPPLRIRGTDTPTPITYRSPVASAQVKSCVLLAGLRASGSTIVSEPHQSRDHTERMLQALGVPLVATDDGFSVGFQGPVTIPGFEFTVPADISSAAFFMVACAMLPHSEVNFRELSLNPSRTGVLDVLLQVGASVEFGPESAELGEPLGDVRVSHRDGLRAFRIEGGLVPTLIDEIPVLAVLATQCEGKSVIKDAHELRVKESDRIEVVADGLRRMGAAVETSEDGMAITGPTPLKGTTIDARHDHRIAMAFAIAGLVASGTTMIQGAEAISTSFPRFVEELRGLCVV